MIHRKNIGVVQIHFIQCKQLREENVNSHVFQQISDLKIFSECLREPLKALLRATLRPAGM